MLTCHIKPGEYGFTRCKAHYSSDIRALCQLPTCTTTKINVSLGIFATLVGLERGDLGTVISQYCSFCTGIATIIAKKSRKIWTEWCYVLVGANAIERP